MRKDKPTQPNSSARRVLLSSLVGGSALSSGWITPVVESLLLPGHAQNSRPGLGRHPGTETTQAAQIPLRQNPQVVGQNTSICDTNPFFLRSDSRLSVLIRQHPGHQYRYGFIYYDTYANNSIAATLPPSNPNGTSEGHALLLLQVVAPLQVKVENLGHGRAWEVRSAVLDVGQFYGGASDTYRYQLTVFNNEVTPRTRHDTYVVFALSIDAQSGATFVQGQIGPDCVTGSLITTTPPPPTTTTTTTTPVPPPPTTTTTTTTTTTPAPPTTTTTTTTPAPTPRPPTTPTPTPAPTPAPTPGPLSRRVTILLWLNEGTLSPRGGENNNVVVAFGTGSNRRVYYNGPPQSRGPARNQMQIYRLENVPADSNLGILNIHITAAKNYAFTEGASTRCWQYSWDSPIVNLCEVAGNITIRSTKNSDGRYVANIRSTNSTRTSSNDPQYYSIILDKFHLEKC